MRVLLFVCLAALVFLLSGTADCSTIVLQAESPSFSLIIPDSDSDGALDFEDPNPNNPDSDGDGIPDGADGDIVSIEVTSSTHPDPLTPYPGGSVTFRIKPMIAGIASFVYAVDNRSTSRISNASPELQTVQASLPEQDITLPITATGNYYFHIAARNATDAVIGRQSTRAFRATALYRVPNLVGLSRGAAQQTLTSAGLTAGTVTEQWHDTVPAGIVISQTVVPGDAMTEVGPVGFAVSKGKVTAVFRFGDVNMDGAIAINDYGAVLQAQQPNASPESRILADVTHDGAVNMADAQLLLNYLRSGGFVTATVRRLIAQAGAQEVLLVWQPIPHDNVSKYRVYRTPVETKATEETLIAEPTDTVLTDDTVETRTYLYSVSFVDILGNETGRSLPVEVTANTLILELPTVWGKAGDTVRVPINMGNARGLVPNGLFIPFSFDTSIASFVDVKPTALTAGLDFYVTPGTGPGDVFIASQDTEISLPGGEGRFFDVYLKLKQDAGEGCKAMTLRDVVLADSQGQTITTLTSSGSLCVGDGLWGDLNLDGVITEEDALFALEIAVEKQVLSPDDERNLFGDLNGDGMIDSADAVMILRLARNLAINPESAAKAGVCLGDTPRSLTLGSVSGPKNCTVNLPVLVDDAKCLAGLDLVISFPRGALECVGVQNTPATADFKLENQIAPGYARISLGEAESMPQGTAHLLNIEFKLIGDISNTQNPAPVIKVNYAELKGELGESFRWYTGVAKQNGEVIILPATECPTTEGEVVEGLLPEGETPEEGQILDGEPAEGQTRPEGAKPEGQIVLDGENPEGESPAEGLSVDGELPEGQTQQEPAPSPSVNVGCFVGGTNIPSQTGGDGLGALLICAVVLTIIGMRPRQRRIAVIAVILFVGVLWLLDEKGVNADKPGKAVAPSLGGVIVTQDSEDPGLIHIQHDLQDETAEAYDVAFSLSADNGSTFPVILSALTGDFGSGVQPGISRQVSWRWMMDVPYDVAQAKIRVSAERPELTGPTAAFVADVTRAPVPVSVQFTDQSQAGTHPITSWLWSFGDGQTSTDQNPTHLYGSGGQFTVALTVSNHLDSSTLTMANYVSAVPALSTFEINGGDPTTNSLRIVLNNVCTAATEYMVSENASFVEATWQPYSESLAFSLTPGTGTKIAFFKTRNSGGESSVLSDSIELTGYTAGDGAVFGGIEFAWCPPGTFTMGSPGAETDRGTDEGPQHQVTISRGFWMSRREVTQAQWIAIKGSNPSSFLGNTERPVEQVSWGDITGTNGYLAALNAAHPGKGFRLPTEAEWEYAYRAGGMSRFYWGADNDLAQIDDFVWYFDNSEGMTQEVGQRSPNSFGLYDMGGNVWEWCQDWYGSYSSNSSVDPTGPATGTYRVQRGGSWASDSAYCRAAVRSFGDPAYRDSTNGFRVVMPESTSATPSAAFSANLTSGTAPLTVAFTDTSLAGSSTITGWMWSFGDGLTSSVRNPQHTYATAGAYDVSLTVTSNSGSDTELKPDFISVTDIAEGETEGEQIPAGQIGYLAGIEFAWCPPGSFSMGSPETEKDRYSNEGPQHTVTISHGFWLSNCEVTKAQWQTVMATTPWSAQSYILSDPNSPAVFISWNDITGANGFIPKMTLAHPNHGIRLPTEAEWEYACRAGTQARFFWGDDPSYAQIGAYAWYDGNAWSAGEQYAHVVGQKAANLWGLHDMSGNVWEWCQDLYGVYPSGNVTDPTGPTTGASRVLRGGSWSYLGLYSRSAHRFSANAGSRNNHSGFRLVAASMDE